MNGKHMRDEMARRLNNLALALEGSGCGGYAPGFSLAASNKVRTGSTIPILYGEAEETEKALRALTKTQRHVLVLQFIECPPVHLRHSKLGLTRRTFYRLVEASSKKFWNALNELKRKDRLLGGRALDTVARKATMPPMLVKLRRHDD